MKICSIEGCNNGGKIIKGCCIKHYTQILRHGKVLERTIYDPNEIIIKGDIAEIVLYDKKCKEKARTIIDAEDVEKIKEYKWSVTHRGYVETYPNGKTVGIQHIIMGMAPNKKRVIDHKDRNTLNNRKYNFRFCTNTENSRNSSKPKHNTSGVKGVYWHKAKNKWQAQIKVNQKQTYLGIFKNKTEAIFAYNKAARKYFGEFAYQNKI